MRFTLVLLFTLSLWGLTLLESSDARAQPPGDRPGKGGGKGDK